jgi:ubiquitin-conjugating enzyme E2 J2
MTTKQKNITEPTLVCKKRIEKEYNDMKINTLPNIKIAQDPSNILNWYCLIYGLEESGFNDGEYIFNIKLNANYPFEPPEFFFLTPNGRFETSGKLCFSNSSYHKESWSPLWSIKTIILGFLSFFLEKTSSGIGHLTNTIEFKIDLANKSKEYNKTKLTSINKLFE